jgi:hypothetical protein
LTLHDPGNERKIEEVFVFLSIDEEGRNGIVASFVPGLGAMPLVSGKLGVAEQMKLLAEGVAHRSGKPVGLYRFTRSAQLWRSDKGTGNWEAMEKEVAAYHNGDD